MSRFKKVKPLKFEVEKELDKFLDNDTKLEDIDSRWLDLVIYWYPNLYLQWQSKREQKARRK